MTIMQFGFMPGKGMTHALFILRRMQEEFCGKEKKLYMYSVDLEKTFNLRKDWKKCWWWQ